MTDGDGLLFQAWNLRKTFGTEEVLSIGRLKIRRGKMTAIVGASGSGKTTLLNILGGLDKPDDGARIEVWLDDRFSQLDAEGLQSAMARRASYAFQQGHLLPNATLRLNLSLASRGQAQEGDFKEAILRSGLGPELEKDAKQGQDLLARRTWGLSGGQSQRLNVARAYARQPSIVFADEPSSNLDPGNAQHVIHELKEWIEAEPDERSVVLVTHDHELASRADDLIILHKGQLVYGGEEPAGSLPAESIRRKLAEYADGAEGAQAAKAAGALPHRPKRFGTLARLRDAVALAWQETIAARADNRSRLSPMRFRQWQSLFSYALLLFLLVGLIYAQGYAQAYFEREMADPGVRHVIISSNPLFTDETRLTPDLLAELKERPRFATKGIYPRRGKLETLFVDQPETGEKVERLPRFNFEILSLDPEEDAAKGVKLVDVEGNATSQTLAEALQAKDRESGRIALALDRKYFLGITRKLKVPPPELERRLRLVAQGRLVPFDFVGLYDVAVPDRGYVFQGIMSIASHVNWAVVLGPRMWLDDDGRPRFYERAAVYFDIDTYKQTLKELSKTNFAFNRDNFQKLERLFDVSLEFKWLLGVLIACVSIFALCILFFNALAQMSRVWKSALILLAHGVPAYIFALSVSTQIAIGLGLAAGLCYALFFAVAGLIQQGPPLLAALHQGLGLLGIFAAVTVVGVFIGVYAMAPSRTALGEQLKSN